MSNPLIFDNTRLSSLRACYRRHHYRHEKHLTLPTVAGALNLGTAVHVAYSSLLHGQSKDIALARAIKSWRPQTVADGEWRTPISLIAAVDAMYENFDLKPITTAEGMVLAEVSFAWPLLTVTDNSEVMEKVNKLGYDSLYYSGIIDCIAEYMGAVWVVDHKTTSKMAGDKRKGEKKYIPSSYFNHYKPHAATTGYLWGASHFFQKAPIGVIINGIGIDENENTAFGKATFTYTPSEIEEWRRKTVLVIEQYLDAKLQGLTDEVYNEDSCFEFGRPCPYWELCKVPKESRLPLEAMYIVEPWEVLKQRKKEAAAAGLE